MECTEARSAIPDWARDPASMPKSARLHLESCSSCASLWSQEQELTAALATLRAGSADASASRAVRAAVLSSLPQPAAPSGWGAWKPALALAAVLVSSVVAGWYISRPQSARHAPQAAVEPLYTDFFPLTTVALDRHDAAQLVRIRLPRREMRRFGLPVSEELERSPIEADVLIGQDGIARAVRFVSQSY